ncbi:MAG: SpoIIE family protein phosphatase [Leptospira sp.]|nr:SpoIIE family protein phosphatase [Leptospira sp.]NCS95490.1 SpoIIE family protein phosphatase [Leptospira sp.]
MRKVLILFIVLIFNPIYTENLPNWQYSKSINLEAEISNFEKEMLWIPVNFPYNLADLPTDTEYDLYWLRTNFSVEHWDPNSALSIRLGIILDCERIWLNAKEIHLNQDCSSNKPQAYDKIRILDLPRGLIYTNKKNEIRILVKRYFPNEIGLVQDKIDIDYSNKIYKDYYLEEGLRLSFLIVYLTVASYFLFLFIRRPQEKEYLFFALFTINLVLYQFLRCQSKYFLDIEFWILKKWEYCSLPSFIPFMAHFIRSFFRYTYNKINLTLDLLTLVSIVFIFSISDILILDKWNRYLIQPIWILYLILSLYILFRETRKSNKNAFLILIGILAIVVSAIIDILAARFVWNIPRISGYIFMGNILFQAFILANRFVQINDEVEDLNKNLELKVTDRTQSLAQSLNEIQKLKTSQDGDYFLTSLLLKPLHRNCKTNSFIKTEFQTLQKKQFEFKNKMHQIGGDLTLTEEIELKGKKFILFINSDSMGKSIQGAGGALVLGVIVESLLARLKNLNFRNKYPERWLKDAFLDIQKAFETFDGSMFVSMVMGLVDTSNGFLYYFNAEHPQPIIYRDGKATFLPSNETFYLRKIGIKENELHFFIETFQLEPQDKIYIGTDGKDDIYFLDAEGNKFMNENENNFLKLLEKTDGKIEDSISDLQNSAELADDISILKIENTNVLKLANPPSIDYLNHLRKAKTLIKKGYYQNAKKELIHSLNLNPKQLTTIILLGKLEYQLKNYEDAILIWSRGLECFPESKELIYLQAIALRKSNLILESIDTAERIRLRQPDHKQALLLLNELYSNNYQHPSFNKENIQNIMAA